MTANGGMGDEYFIGQGGDELIATGRKFGGGGECGKNQQASGGQGLFTIRGHALGRLGGLRGWGLARVRMLKAAERRVTAW
jgi:hypothetical protein